MKEFRPNSVAILGLLVISVVLTTSARAAPAAKETPHEKVRVPILTLPIGAGIYEWWASYERIFETYHPWLRVAAQETPGFVYNMKEMGRNKKRWKTHVFGTSEAVAASAEHAIEPFFRERINSKAFKYLYPIAGYGAATWFWVTLDPKIKTMMDFNGKRVGVGLRGQVNWGLWPTVALETLGINAKLEYLGPHPALDALLDGRVDAAQVNVYLAIVQPPGKDVPARPLAILQKLIASRKKFYYVNYDNNWTERLKQQKGYLLASPLEVEAATLPQQDKKVFGIQSIPSGWAVHETFPEEIAYEFTKFMVQHGNKLAKYSKMGMFFVIPKGLLKKMNYTEENVHPGAVRAYKEAGLWE